jgi:hypothetical protein
MIAIEETYLTTSSCSVHCWCCRGWGAPDSKEPLAAAGAAGDLGSAARRATGEVGVLGIGMDEATGSGLEQDSEQAPTDGESRGAVGGGGVGRHQA